MAHWPLTDGLYIWYSEEGPGRAVAPPSPLLAVPNAGLFDMALKNLGFLGFLKNLKSPNLGFLGLKTNKNLMSDLSF